MSRRQSGRRSLPRDPRALQANGPMLYSARPLSRGGLLAGASMFALVLAMPAAQARPFGSAATMSAPSLASDAAAAASQQAAAVAAQSQNALARATRAIQAIQAVQSAARNAARASGTSQTLPQLVVPNGLAAGGLRVAPGATPGSALWQGANLPTQTTTGGQTSVNIQQTSAQAILNWQTFNVGAQTTVNFNQQASNWTALNRVTGNLGPSQILGNINAAGQVLVINQNGIIFGGASQINVGSLIASTANITDQQFLTKGIYSAQSGNGYLPSFTGAGGKIVVEQGALITTTAPVSITAGGGFVALLGTEVANAGTITTPKGQALLAAGDDFILRPGYGTNANQYSTTRGNEVAPVLYAGSTSGTVSNTGLIFSQQGDITLAGHAIVQDGILLSTTSVDQRGTIHLLNSASDTGGSVTLTANSINLILPELASTDTALNSQRDGLIGASGANDQAKGQFDNISTLADRKDQSRVEIVTGGLVDFQNGSLTMAQGGQVVVSAGRRVFVESGATIDVSGTNGAVVPMSANEVSVNIQGNELRDSPQNRDSGTLFNKNVWIDVRDLTLVPAGTGGYATDRYYTPGGLLEVSGYLNNTGHTIGEWTAVGGTITLAAPEVVAQRGSTFNISGGSVQYQGGYLPQTYLLGSDGRVYNINNAPADLTYVAVAHGFVVTHLQGGKIDPKLTEVYLSPFGRSPVRWENGYTVGRDAGSLILSAPTAIFEGSIVAAIVDGERQINARPSGVTDGYKLTQNTAPLAGTLALGQYGSAGLAGAYNTDVKFGNVASIASGLDPTTVLPAERGNTAWFDVGLTNSFGLGGLSAATASSIAVDAPLNLAPGAQVRLVAPVVDIAADITARSGSVTVTNFLKPDQGSAFALTTPAGTSQLTLRAGATIDVRGLWTNALTNPTDLSGLAFVNGGNVTFDSTQNVTLASGSAIDVSSRAAILANGKTRGGTGGNVTLVAGDAFGNLTAAGTLTLDAAIRAAGVNGGGTLTVSSPGNILIGDNASLAGGVLAAGTSASVALTLAQDLTIPAGQPLPLSQSNTFTSLGLGQIAPVDIKPVVGPKNLTIAANWTVPQGMGGVWVNNNTALYGEGQVVPAGSVVSSFLSGSLILAGTSIDTKAFPNGLPVQPYVVVYTPGSIQTTPTTYRAGTVIPAGVTLAQTVLVTPAPALKPSFFSAGFASYDINGVGGVLVADGTTVAATMPVYRFTSDSFATPSGTDPAAAMALWLPPTFTENPQGATLTQRGGASLTLRSLNMANGVASGGAIVVGHGASITVDPGKSIKLDAFGQITVDGSLTARGGSISLINEADGSTEPSRNFDTAGNGRGISIWVGGNARLDVSGEAVSALDLSGRAYGLVTNGGSIYLGGNQVVSAKTLVAASTTAFLIIRPGAELDADGAQVAVDPAAGTRSGATGGSLTLASNGGSIALDTYSGIYNDGDLHAASGGAGAAGGSLAIALNTPIYPNIANVVVAGQYLANGVLTVVQTAQASTLPANIAPGTNASSLAFGRATVSADAVKSGGFDSLSLTSGNTLLFSGDVSLSLGQSLTLTSGSIASGVLQTAPSGPTSIPGSSTVNLAAPYVLMRSLPVANTDNTVTPNIAPTIAVPSAGTTFTVNADQIDVQGTVGFATAYKTVALTSQGDIRLLATAANMGATTSLQTWWELDLKAAQVYPTTGAVASIGAGTLSISRISAIDPALPLSVFGSLVIQAGTIEQGGIVRAPLGLIVLGDNGGGPAISGSTKTLDLLPGSITSVSAAGLTIPYGGTVDGVTYSYNGSAITPRTFNTDVFGRLGSGVVLAGQSVNVQNGATLDLSGGGTVAGAGFVSGRGGSVNVLNTALINANPATPVSASGDKVYAIVPGYGAGYAPVAPENGAGDPVIGQQITIPAGVPGLPAGTYTLLPSNYALLPGAYRVELGKTTSAQLSGVGTIGNGTYVTTGTTSIANTAIRSSLPSLVLITPGKAVRSYSQYNEESYSDFLIANAALFGAPRPLLPADGKGLELIFETPSATATAPAFTFDGTALLQGALGGADGTVFAASHGNLEVYATTPTAGFNGVSISQRDLDAIGAPRLVLGGFYYLFQPGAVVTFAPVSTAVTIGDNVTLTAKELFLVGGAGGITVGSGATLTTVGQGAPPFDSSNGYAYGTNGAAVLALSNGDLEFTGANSPGMITIGAGASLYSEGTLAFASSGGASIDSTAHFGSRNIALAAGAINIGDVTAIAAAGSPSGLLFNQALFNVLVGGDPAHGAPALERITLSASGSINLFGNASLDASGSNVDLVFNTPAIYGYGAAGDHATIAAGKIVWNGIIGAAPPAIVARGPGTGQGSLDLVANEIDFGQFVSLDNTSTSRVAYGFADVRLIASSRIVSAGNSSLFVYQAPSTTAGDVFGQSGVGGNLTLSTPLLTGAQKSVMAYTTGGQLSVTSPAGLAPSTATSTVAGAEIDLTGDSVAIASTILLPSGKLVVNATHDIALNAGSRLDLSGQPSKILSATVYGFGGTVILDSLQGGIVQAAGAVIDVSATQANAGSISVSADSGGAVSLDGALIGVASNGYTSGDFSVTAGTLADFAGLNTRLTQGGVFDARSFDIKSGDLVIGSEVKAHQVTVSVDGGSLTVNGTIDASGAAPGTIRLAAKRGLTLASTAVLDAHGSVLQVDSYHQPIEAKNRGTVELTASQGMLTLAPGATIDLSTPDGVARGQISLNASRTGETSGDININASGPLTIKGAQSIAVNAFWTYSPTDTYGTIVQDNGEGTGGSPVSGATGWLGMNQVDARSQTFIAAALANSDLQGRLAGLKNYADAFHLRPGVEIDSSTPNGTLTIAGGLDLSGFRYQSLNPNFQKTAIYGSGEPGALVIRAGGNLDVVGSISDGFMPAPATPDDNGWVLQTGVQKSAVETLLPIALNAGTTFPNTAGVSLRYAISINAATIQANAVIPVQVTLSSAYTIPAGTRLTAPVYDGSGNVLYPAGTVMASATVLPAGSQLGANSVMPGNVGITAMLWSAGANLGVFTSAVTLSTGVTVPFEGIIPSGTNVQMATSTASTRSGASGRQGSIAAIAPMLPQGSLSWSMRLVSGADLGAADSRVVKPTSLLGASGVSGNLTLVDGHRGSTANQSFYFYYSGRKYGPYAGPPQSWCSNPGYSCAPGPTIFAIGPSAPSVLRTGTGNLDLIAGGSFSEQSLFGVYTAGTQSAPVLASDGGNPYNQPRGLQNDGTLLGSINQSKAAVVQAGYQAWYPEHGGDVLLSAQRDVTGYIATTDSTRYADSDQTGNWLWRQGGGGLATQPTAWWINFGTYAHTNPGQNPADATLIGFQGIGTLGGGNLTVVAGRNAGVSNTTVSTGLDLAVASTGRVLADGTLVQTGGGDLILKVGGALNPVPVNGPAPDFYGSVTDLRGNISISAGSIGTLAASSSGTVSASLDPRTPALGTFKDSFSSPGPTVTPGDGSVSIATRGDLVLGGAGDAGMATAVDQNGIPYTLLNPDGSTTFVAGGGGSSFTLWTPTTAIALYSAGGDVAPLAGNGNTFQNAMIGFYPGTLTVAAANGDIRFYERTVGVQLQPVIELAPSPVGQLELLANGSIYGSGQVIAMSGASMSSLATPFRPAFTTALNNASFSNASAGSAYLGNSNFNPIAFGPDTPKDNLHAGDSQPALVYAGVDIDDLTIGQLQNKSPNLGNGFVPADSKWYIAAKPFEVIAGRDIVGTGATPDVFFNNGPDDISLVQAGRDIIYQSITVAGPGLLDVQAGRNLYQGYYGSLVSAGDVVSPANTSNGAGISVMAGVGPNGPDYADFAKLYFDAANQLPGNTPLAGSGKVAHAYDQELLSWLQQRFGYGGTSADALGYFLALPKDQQGVFVRDVYYKELTLGGREYNDPASSRFGSYLRGREAIAALFPTTNAQGQALTYTGGITMFSGVTVNGLGTKYIADAGIRTQFGGAIQILDPAGRTIIGVEGVTPGANAGLLTQGQNSNIDIYSLGSILLGQSRIMTTFGGDILAWSAEGDINAGRGSKTTTIFTPPLRSYDLYGNVTVSPAAPSSGAGIAGLSTIPGTRPSNIDLIAPLGTIDAGEAGIRVSGNINLAALQIVNSANIQVQGTTTGIPTVQGPPVGALTAASNAGAATQQAAGPPQTSSNGQPSVIIVEVLGYGGCSGDDSPEDKQRKTNERSSLEPQRYDPRSKFQVIGNGELTDEEKSKLTEQERNHL